MDNKCPKCHSDNPDTQQFCGECGTQLKPVHAETRTLRTPAKDSMIGEIVSEKYKLLEELGSGGMGVVYKAEQIKPVKRSVALKIIKLGMDTKQVVARFETERQALAVMDHPNIAKVFDGGATETGRPYFVMELVRGIPITEYCDKHKLTTKERLKLFTHICQAIQHAHQKGVIHRDLKPSNVLIVVQEDKPVPKIIDFGIAKATEHSLTERTLFTEQGQLIGTPEYMSPEQAEMSGLDVDTRTDIYSLGVMLYELLVGVLPFDQETLRSAGFGEIQRIIRETEPPKASTRLSSLGDTQTSIAEHRRTDPSSLHRQLKGDLDWILLKALEKDRTRRYETANGLALDIQRYISSEPVLARPPSAGYRMAKFAKRHKVGLGAGLLVVAALVLGLALATTGLIRAKRAEAIAATERDRANQEAVTAKQVSDFLMELFKVSDPSEALGNTITAREILDKGAENIEKELKDQPEIQATLMSTMGEVYQSLGLYEQATPLLENALSIRMGLYGDEHLDVCSSMNNLANLLTDKADYEGAEQLLRKAIEIHQRLKGGQKEYAIILNSLAGLLLEKRDLEAAEPLFREALEIQRKLLGEEDPDVADTLNNLAGVLNEKGNYPGAEALFREALELRRKLLGDNHPDVATTLNNLGMVLYKKGEYEEAEPLFKESLAVRRKIFGNEHRKVATGLNNLALLYAMKDDYEAVEPLWREALAISRKVLGNKHPLVAISLCNLGWLQREKGEYEEAEALYREALKIFREVFGNEHPEVATTLADLAFLFGEKGDYSEAEALFRDALAMHRRLLGDNHPRLANNLHNLADLLCKKDNYQEAEILFHESLEIYQKTLPEGHLKTIKSMRELGNCLANLKRFEEAEKLLLESYRLLESKSDKKDKDIIKALNHIIELYKSWGKTDKAAEYSAILKKMRLKNEQ